MAPWSWRYDHAVQSLNYPALVFDFVQRHSQKSLSRLGILSDTIGMLLHTLDSRLSLFCRRLLLLYRNRIHPGDDYCHWKFPESLIQRSQRPISICMRVVNKKKKRCWWNILLKRWTFIGFGTDQIQIFKLKKYTEQVGRAINLR